MCPLRLIHHSDGCAIMLRKLEGKEHATELIIPETKLKADLIVTVGGKSGLGKDIFRNEVP